MPEHNKHASESQSSSLKSYNLFKFRRMCASTCRALAFCCIHHKLIDNPKNTVAVGRKPCYVQNCYCSGNALGNAFSHKLLFFGSIFILYPQAKLNHFDSFSFSKRAKTADGKHSLCELVDQHMHATVHVTL